jgi:hypothetical protein
MYRFQSPADGAVGGLADEGRGKLTLIPPVERRVRPMAGTCRDGTIPQVTEQELLEHITRVFAAAGTPVSRLLLANYYVSLKTNPFVALAGPPGIGKANFVATFAEALLGRDSGQYALIPAGAAWTGDTGERGYFRTVLERFTSLRFLDLLQDAAAPSGAGKAFLVCFSGLRPEEFSYYFGTLLRVDADGRKRLTLPGVPLEQAPVLPANLSITATVHSGDYGGALSAEVLRNAGLMHFRSPLRRGTTRRTPAAPPPVGYQRIWLRASARDAAAAEARLHALIGAEVGRLRPSPELARLLWRGGIVLSSRTLRELTLFVAGSFDELGRGLFDPADPLNNARVAYDAQVVQRVLWKLHDSDDAELKHDLAAYLDRLAPEVVQQAVA